MRQRDSGAVVDLAILRPHSADKNRLLAELLTGQLVLVSHPGAIDAVTLTRIQRPLHIEGIPLQHADMLVVIAKHIGQILALLAVGQNVIGLQEGHYLAERQGRNRVGLVLVAIPRGQANNLLAALAGLTQTRLAIDPAQLQHVTGVNPVWVGDLGIDVPETWPEPGFGQILARDIPEGIPLLHHITLGITGFQRQLLCHGTIGQGCRQTGEDDLLQMHNTPCYFCTQSVAVFCRRK